MSSEIGTNEPTYEAETVRKIEKRLVLAKGRGLGKKWSGRLGLADVNFY